MPSGRLLFARAEIGFGFGETDREIAVHKAFPLRGRWQPEGLTDEVFAHLVFAVGLFCISAKPAHLISQKTDGFLTASPQGEAFDPHASV